MLSSFDTELSQGKSGDGLPDPPAVWKQKGSDVIYGERRGQSQKPEEMYELVESVVPNGRPSVLSSFPFSFLGSKPVLMHKCRREIFGNLWKKE